jgi:hypothetical protein
MFLNYVEKVRCIEGVRRKNNRKSKEEKSIETRQVKTETELQIIKNGRNMMEREKKGREERRNIKRLYEEDNEQSKRTLLEKPGEKRLEKVESK